MESQGYFKIRPAGRHILSIGSELINDEIGAIIEIVKNSYDADATRVDIFLERVDCKDYQLNVLIQDNGHGMSYETVTTTWMTPSTSDKLGRGKSPRGRNMQGRKGVGRYAASILGVDLLLETFDKKTGTTTGAYLEWKLFEKAQFLSDVQILIESPFKDSCLNSAGTRLEIKGDENNLSFWTAKHLDKLIFELKKLIPPNNGNFTDEISVEKDKFDIYLNVSGFLEGKYRDYKEKIEPFPLLDLSDYRIWGEVSDTGKASIFYENRIKESDPIPLNFQIPLEKDEAYCGDIKIDFRVFDRESIAITRLLKRFEGKTGEPIGKREMRRLLNIYNGIGVYRNGFRIRPLGDSGYDWLRLDAGRYQNPTLRVSSNQVIGYVYIREEEISQLNEKTARDGLKENKQFLGLKKICKAVLSELEKRRYEYRKQSGASRSKRLDRDFENLFSLDKLKNSIIKELNRHSIDEETSKKILALISKEEDKSLKLVSEIKEAIAVYQGQATVGKIVHIFLHEGRRPLNYITGQASNLLKAVKVLKKNNDKGNVLTDIVKFSEGIKTHSGKLAELFKKVDPLAARRRAKRKKFNLLKNVESAFELFGTILKDNHIKYDLEIDPNLELYGWEGDFYQVFVNLIDNSIFWLNQKQSSQKQILVSCEETNQEICIKFQDNGVGIEDEFIESQIIFEPDFSGKVSEGSGLGLAIAGEAINRNNGKLSATHSEFESGAQFLIQLKKQ